jgi:signal transduction histidine kinase
LSASTVAEAIEPALPTVEGREQDAERLRGYLLSVTGLTVVSIALLIGLYPFWPSPIILTIGSSMTVYALFELFALRLTTQRKVDEAITWYSVGFWQFALVLGLGGLGFYALLVLSSAIPLVVAAPYVSTDKLRKMGFAAFGVMFLGAAYVMTGLEVTTDPLPSWVVRLILGIGIPATSVTLIVGLWQSRHILTEALESTTRANDALRESERSLEQKVARRTSALESSREELALARDEAVAANRHKSTFLANMSHELRTPLNAVIGFSEVLLEKVFGELNEKQDEYINDIHNSGKHLLSLINDILDLSKIEAGRLELSLSAFDLTVAVDNALVLMRERAMRAGVTLTKEIEAVIVDIMADERKFKQILINLLTNAVKFTQEGGSVSLTLRRNGDDLEVAVADTGIGIAPEHQELIFDEFRQAGDDYARAQEGTGLGLALTKRLIEAHGGRIWLESELGRGSTFSFVIPMSGPAPDEAGA